MGSFREYLISIFYDNRLLRCAVKIDLNAFPGDMSEHYMEPENRELLRQALPQHVQELGPIVDIVLIFEVVDLTRK